MIFVIPMAGSGLRFAKAGYKPPKMLIQSSGISLFEWAMKSLPLEIADMIIFICLEKDLKNHPELLDLIKNVSHERRYKTIAIPEVTEGQMCTVMKAEELINNEEDLVIYNIDTYFVSKTLRKKLCSAKEENIDGVLGAFRDTSARWSFAKIGPAGFVEETSEKNVISDIALTGLYHFTRGSDFVRIAKRVIENNIRVKNEFYVAPMYNLLIQEGKRFIVDFVDEFWCMGTPEDLQYFEENY